jgi:hypothetical protein
LFNSGFDGIPTSQAVPVSHENIGISILHHGERVSHAYPIET